ncbi:MAG: glycosyltransferase family 2 protein [Akkermansia sp.]|nr:glycosyltransferase family 2 protein [Akkermansia sp.]
MEDVESQIKISVIVPVYNMEQYVGECLDSVLTQTLKELEVVCTNDGSTDNSLDILNDYAERDARVIVIDSKNEGAGCARNKALVRARGEYVFFLDPDDKLSHDEALATLYNKAIENNALICGGGVGIFTNEAPDLVPIDIQCFSEEKYINYSDYQFEYGYTRFIYSRKMLSDNGLSFPHYRWFEDPPFMVKAMITAGRFYVVPGIIYSYRYAHKVHQWSESKVFELFQGVADVWKDACDNHFEKLKDSLREHVTDLYRLVGKFISTKHLALLDEMDDDLFKRNRSVMDVVCSKHKHFAITGRRCISIFGINIRYQRRLKS